tara:strand:+ start:273 stop:1877 length:1605 start_codon:yes stop_codon:yes gene_type:complete
VSFTKITAAGIGSTETVTIDGLSVINDGSFGGNVSVAGTLTYEDVTNIDSVGLITARAGVVVGSGITLSPDGDIFFTGIITGNGSALTGVASTENIRTNTNATFLQNINVSGTTTATSALFTGAVDASNGITLDDAITHRNDTNTKIRFPTDDTVSFETAGSERIRIGSSGQIGIGGANYGTSGQVLKSGGSGSSVTWGSASASSLTDSGDTARVTANTSGAIVTGILTATKGGIGIGSTTYSGRVAGVSTVVGTIQYDAEVNKVVVFTKALQWQGIHEVGQLPQFGLMGAYNFFMPLTYSDFSNAERVRCASTFISRYDVGGGVNEEGNAAQYCTPSGGLDNGPYINYVGRTNPNNHFFYLGYSHANLKYDPVSYSCWYRGDNSVGNGSWYTGTALLGDTRNSVAGNFGFNSSGKISMHIDNNSAIEYSGSVAVNDNTWHCLGFVSSPTNGGGGYLKLYVDGELLMTVNTPAYHSSLHLDCVGGNYNYTDMVPERMAATAMWNRELTDAEMKQAFFARNFNSMGNDFIDIKNN